MQDITTEGSNNANKTRRIEGRNTPQKNSRQKVGTSQKENEG